METGQQPDNEDFGPAGDEGQGGYPEEQPAGANPGGEHGGEERKGGRAEPDATRAPDGEDSTATGNPGAAGEERA